jgi:hypothetical protein
VQRCVASVQSQALVYARPNAIADRLGFRMPPTPSQIEEVARHIAEFSIAGVHAVGRVAPAR